MCIVAYIMEFIKYYNHCLFDVLEPQQSTVETFHPFQMRDNLSASKFTETSQVIQTSELKTERSSSIARTTTSTRYEANTNSIENGTKSCYNMKTISK